MLHHRRDPYQTVDELAFSLSGFDGSLRIDQSLLVSLLFDLKRACKAICRLLLSFAWRLA
jgi:hypothetical protein